MTMVDDRPAQGVLQVLDRTGDSRFLWSPDNPDEVKAARQHFNKLKKKGYLAYTVKENGDKGEVIREFDETAGKIIMSPQLVGG